MSYRFVKVTAYYRDFLRQYYERHPKVRTRPYAEQLDDLMGQAYAWSDFYARQLRHLGVEAHEIVANAAPLQSAWASEHGAVAGGDILLDQLRALKPEVVFFQDSLSFSADWIAKMKREVPSVRLTIGWCCTNYNETHLEQFRMFDFICVCSPKFQQEFSSYGMKAYQFHHAFEPDLLPQLPKDNAFPESDFIFLGSIVPGARGHNLRRDVLTTLVHRGIRLDMYAHFLTIQPMDLFLRRTGYIAARALAGLGLSTVAKKLPFIQKAYYLEELPGNPEGIADLQRIAKPPVYGLEMFKALSRSKIGFNYHGEGAGEYAANIRLFEVTGVGSCLLTDWKRNLSELFDIDSEIVAFRSADECVEKVQWLLGHPKERAEIAARGQRRVLRDHTYRHRAEHLHALIQEHLAK